MKLQDLCWPLPAPLVFLMVISLSLWRQFVREIPLFVLLLSFNVFANYQKKKKKKNLGKLIMIIQFLFWIHSLFYIPIQIRLLLHNFDIYGELISLTGMTRKFKKWKPSISVDFKALVRMRWYWSHMCADLNLGFFIIYLLLL